MHNIFIKAEDLGIVEMILDEVFVDKPKRKRQVALRMAVTQLKILKLIPDSLKVTGFSRGFNMLGDKGFWVVSDEAYTSVKPGALPAASNQDQGDS